MPYGYLGQNTPKQTVSNSGVFSISDVADLEKQGKFGGSLELISTTTVSSAVATIDVQNIQENIYDVHLLQFIGFNGVSNNTEEVQMQFYESGTLETAGVYQFARQRARANGTFNEQRSTASTVIRFSNWDYWDNNGSTSAYMYVYNAGNSSKYTFCTFHNTGFDSEYGGSGTYTCQFGGGVLPQASVVNGFHFKTLFGTNIGAGTIKLYGVKQL